MPTKTSHRWINLPGSYDKNHTFSLYDADNEWGIPTLQPTQFVPDWLLPYGTRIRTDEALPNGATHFFLDDYRFESLWAKPFGTIESASKLGAALSPQFSAYYDWPVALQLWNTYRNRWLGRFWQEQGVEVIPSLAWGTQESYRFAFAGLNLVAKGTVAISSLGKRQNKEVEQVYFQGYTYFMEHWQPCHVVHYGLDPHPYLYEVAASTHSTIHCYPTHWDSIRRAKKRVQEQQGQKDETQWATDTQKVAPPL